MAEVALLSLVTASIAFTITVTSLFAGFRRWLQAKHAWLGKLVGCGYCLGHWIAFTLVAVYRPKLFEAWWPLDFFLTALVIAWLAAFQWVVLSWTMEKARK